MDLPRSPLGDPSLYQREIFVDSLVFEDDLQPIDISRLQNVFRRAVLCHLEYRAAELFGGGDEARQESLEQRQQWSGDSIEEPVHGRSRTDAMQGLNDRGAKHVRRSERQTKKSVLSPALDPCPHAPAAL